MPRTASEQTSEMAILRRVVDAEEPFESPDAARAILRLRFSPHDRARMNRLAAKNREGALNAERKKNSATTFVSARRWESCNRKLEGP
jgi:hypothetical protein